MESTNLTSHYDLFLVALSVVIAIMASYVALDLAGRVTNSHGRTRLLWLVGGASAMGTGIWSMHFIGMLAFHLPITVHYHVPTVVFSLLAAVIASLIALVVVSGRDLSLPRLAAGGVSMGTAIVTMHYSGMAAMRLEAVTRYDPLLWTLSAAIAVGVSFVGLTLVYRLRGETASGWNWRKVAAAVVMGLAIPSMHYTGMAAAGFAPNGESPPDLSYTVDITSLGGMAITIGTFFLLGIALSLPKENTNRRYTSLPALMVVMAVIVLTIGSVSLHYIETSLVASSGESLALAAADIADKLDRTLYERHSDTQIMARAPIFRGRDVAAKTTFLQTMKATHPYYLWLAVTDAQGRIVAATDPTSVGEDRSQRGWFKDARNGGGVHVRDAQSSEDSGGVLAVAFTAPILGPRGEFQGVVTSRVSLPVLEDVFRQTIQTLQLQRGLASKIEYQFMNRDGDVIADSIMRQEGTVNLKALGLSSALLAGSAQPGYVEEMHLRRHLPVVTGYAQTEQSGDYLGLHWGVLVRMDRSDILTPIRAILWKLGLASALVFVPAIGFLIWTTRRLRQEWTIAQEETTRAKAAEAVTHKVQEWLVTILKSIGDAVIVTDKTGSVSFMNAVAESLTGWQEEEAKTQPLTTVFQIVNEKTRQPAENPAVKVMREGVIAGLANHTVLIAKDGTERPIDDSGAPIRDAQGNLIGVVLVFRDVTERKRAEEELGKAKDAAEAASVAKSEFLASMSHEIRTPMNAIVGMADLLWETPLSQEQKEYVQIFRRAGGTLLTLVNDILDLSKVEAGHLELEEIDFDLNDILEKATEVMAIRAHEKGLELTSHVMSDVPTDLVGDPTRLRQVLLNLLGNAIKFTERGEVVLRVQREPGAGEQSLLRFSVSDTGIGIPPEKLETIFERFTQVDSSTTRRYGGTGLGLTISKRLIELMGGRIWVESRVGYGTTFAFTLRAGVWTGPKRRVARQPVDMHNLNVLVVDDNATNRLILHEVLAGWKARVTEAAGGEEALARLRRAQKAGDPYRLVLLDCRMPDMDGFQVAEAMKCEGGLTSVTVMMLTSDGRGGDLARARELGLAGYMVKPVKRTDLLNAISTAMGVPLSARQESPLPMVSAPSNALPALSILLAEDNEDNRLLIQAYLKPTPYRLDIAENGEVACGKFKVGRYDLVLMDMQMPVMDGYTATGTIREWERANHRPPTPIIALTAHALQGDAQKSLEAGCTAHLTKPIKKATLLAAIAEHTYRVTKEVGR